MTDAPDLPTDEVAPDESALDSRQTAYAVGTVISIVLIVLMIFAWNLLGRSPLRMQADGVTLLDVDLELALIPAGTYPMGSPPEFPPTRAPDPLPTPAADEWPEHDVNFAKNFAIMRTEVTFGLYAEMNDGRARALEPEFALSDLIDPDWPVANVSWDEARTFASWVSGETGAHYRLPSEAEWEYAARGSVASAPAPWSIPANACQHANVRDLAHRNASPGLGIRADGPETSEDLRDFSCLDDAAHLARVASYQANSFGLFDTLGNVAEWTTDCYSANYEDTPRDGGAESPWRCRQQVIRGGAWTSGARQARFGYRAAASREFRDYDIGFRLVRELDWLDRMILARPNTDWNALLGTLRTVSLALGALGVLGFFVLPNLAARTQRQADAGPDPNRASADIDTPDPRVDVPDASNTADPEIQTNLADGTAAGARQDTARTARRAGLAARFARLLDQRTVPQPGLAKVTWREPDTLITEPIAEGSAEPLAPMLLLLHGMFSDTGSSFGGLAPMQGLLERHYASILGWDHYTIQQDPVDNAIALLRALPEVRELDIIAFDSGGVLAELLCRAQRMDGRPPFSEEELAATPHLQQLAELMGDGHPRVRRLVRVACAIRGNTALGHFGESATALLGAIPGFGLLRRVYSMIFGWLWQATLQQPGQRALLPESDTIRLLTPSITVDGELLNIAGKCEPQRFTHRALAKLLRGQDSDLVVLLQSTTGGFSRADKQGENVTFEGPEITHFSLLRDERVQTQITRFLIR